MIGVSLIPLVLKYIGITAPASVIDGKTESSGMIIIRTLTRQLEGQLSFEISSGTLAALSFTLPVNYNISTYKH